MKPKKAAIWTGVVLAGMLLLLILLALTAYVILLLPPVQQYARAIVERQLDSLLVGDVSIGSVRTNLLSQIDIYDIEVMSRTGRDDSITVAHVRARYSLPSLLAKTIHITSVNIEKVRASVSVTPQGEMQIPALPRFTVSDSSDTIPVSRDTVPGWKIAIGRVRISDIDAVYKDSSLHMEGKLSGTEITARFPALDSIIVSLAVPDGHYRSPWWSGEINTLRTTVLIRSTGLEISNIYLNGAGTVVYGSGSIPFDTAGRWDLRAAVSTSLVPVTILREVVPGLQTAGQARADVSWVGTLRYPQLTADLRASRLIYENQLVDTLHFNAAYSAREIMKARLDAQALSGSIHTDLQGAIPALFSKPTFGAYDISVQANKINIDSLRNLAKLPPEFPGTALDVSLAAQGTGIESLPLHAQANLSVIGGVLRESPMLADITLDSRRWNLVGSWGRNSLKGAGILGSNREINGEVAARLSDLPEISQLLIKERVAGSISINASLAGTLDNPRITSELSVDSLLWRTARSDSLRATVTFENQLVHIGRADGALYAQLDSILAFFGVDSVGGMVQVQFSGAGTPENPQLAARVFGSNLFFKQFSADTLSGDISLAGTDTLRWSDLVISKGLSDLRLQGQLLFQPRLSGNATVQFHSRAREKHSNAGDLTATGWFGADSLALDLTVHNVDLSALSPWVPLEDNFAGEFSAEAHFGGALQNISADLDFHLLKPEFGSRRIASLDGKIGFQDSLLTSQLVALLKDEKSFLTIDALVPVRPSQGYAPDMSGLRGGSVTVSGKNIGLAALAAISDTFLIASGPVNLDASMVIANGTWVLDGAVMISNAQVSSPAQRTEISNLMASASLSGTLQNPRATYALKAGPIKIGSESIDSAIFAGTAATDTLVLDTGRLILPKGGLVDIRASVPLAHIDSLFYMPGLDVQFSILSFPIELLSPFAPENMLRSGILRGKGQLRVAAGQPQVVGDIGLEGGRFEVAGLDQEIGPVTASIALEGNRITIKKLQGKLGEGTFSTNGGFSWSPRGITDMQIGLKADNLQLDYDEMLIIRIPSARFQLTNQRQNFLLSGTIRLGPSRYIRDIGIADLVRQVQEGSGIKREPDPFLRRIGLQIKANLEDPFTVDMSLGLIDLLGSLAIRGTAAEPAISGEIHVDEGYLLYLDRRFAIEQGVFRNPDPYVLNPTFDLVARSEVITFTETGSTESYEISLRLSGDLEHPEVNLTSEPQLSQPDIISLLTLGQPLRNIGGELASRLRSLATDQLLGFGTRRLERLLGLERIEIQGDLFDRESDQAPRVAVTKRLSPRLLVTYETAVADLTQRRIFALYRLTRWLFLRGETDTQANSGIDLLFKYSR